MKCWGFNTYGQLGDGTLTPTPRPPWTSPGLPAAWRRSSAGRATPARSRPRAASSAGARTTPASSATARSSTGLRPVNVIRAGERRRGHRCGRRTPARSPRPAASSAGAQTPTARSATTRPRIASRPSTCRTHERRHGDLGRRPTTPAPSPRQARRNAGDTTAALQLGDGTNVGKLVPTAVAGLASGVKAVSAGNVNSCALTTAGGVKCWGNNFSGQIGDGTVNEAYTPVDVSGLASGVSSITVGGFHVCAITSAGGAKCWGGEQRPARQRQHRAAGNTRGRRGIHDRRGRLGGGPQPHLRDPHARRPEVLRPQPGRAARRRHHDQPARSDERPGFRDRDRRDRRRRLSQLRAHWRPAA